MSVLDAMQSGDAQGVLDALKALEPSDRRALAPAVKRLRKASEFDNRTAVAMGCWGVLTAAELTSFRWMAAEGVVVAARELEPPWLNGPDVTRLVEQGTLPFWSAVEIAEFAGFDVPDTDGAISAMVQAGSGRFGLESRLAAHPKVLPLLYRVFEVEGDTRSSLASMNKNRFDWSGALVELMHAGDLDRARLLDGSLEALSRDFPTFRGSWYSRFYEALEPTEAEEAERAPMLLSLLAAQVPQTVAWSLKRVEALVGRGVLGPETLDALEPVLMHRQMGVVKRAAKLAARLGRDGPEAAGEAARVLVTGLIHENTGVQERVCDAIEQLLPALGPDDTEDVRSSMQAMGEALAPSVRARLGVEVIDEPERIQAVTADPLDPSFAIEPVATLDEAVAVVARALEAPDDPELFERALDAMSRHARGGDQWAERMSPLAKRRDVLRRRGGVSAPMKALLWAWIDGDVRRPRLTPTASALERFAVERCVERARWIAAGSDTPPLSVPSHRGGWISLDAFERRLARWSSTEAVAHDRVLALCRLRPQDVPAARELLKDHPACARISTDRRTAFEVPLSHRGSGRYTFWDHEAVSVGPPPEDELDVLRMLDGRSRWTPHWAATVHPWDLEHAFAAGVNGLKYRMDDLSRMDPQLGPALHPWARLGPMGHWLLTLQLLAAESTLIQQGQDVAHAAIAQDRLDLELLGQVFARLLPTKLLKPKRWVKALGPVAAGSAKHGRFVHAWVVRGLRGTAAPRDLGTLLEFVRELGIAHGIALQDAEARAYLEGLTMGGKTGKLAKLLLSGA